MPETPTRTSGEVTTPPTSLSARRMWAILLVVLIADALDLLDATITNIAAPTIVGNIGGGPALIKWLGSAYALALGSLLVVGGRLGDKFGQRRLFLIGMTGFTLASAAAGLSVNPTMMIIARLFQGAFGALLIPQGIAIMTRNFAREMRATAFGAFGPMLGIAGIGGPVLAGFIINADIAGLSWRPIFLINIVLGGIGLLAAIRVLPHDNGDRSIHVDGAGSTLLGAAMFGLLFGLIEGSTNGWTVAPLASIAGGLVAFALFAWRQATAADPLLKATLLKNKGFTSGLIMGLAFFAAISGTAYVLSLFLQQGLGYNPGRTSVALLPLTVGLIAAAGACMALITKLGRTLLFIGLLITLAGVGWMLAVVTASRDRHRRVGDRRARLRDRYGHGYLLRHPVRHCPRRRRPRRSGQRERRPERRTATRSRHRIGRGHLGVLRRSRLRRRATRDDPQPVGRHRDRRAVHGDRPPPAEEGGGRRATLTHLPATAPLRRTIPDGRRSSGPWLQGCTPHAEPATGTRGGWSRTPATKS